MELAIIDRMSKVSHLNCMIYAYTYWKLF